MTVPGASPVVPSVELRGVAKTFGDGFQAVRGLDLSIRIGEGKTCATHRLASPTALRTILLEAAESGSLSSHAFSQG